MGKIDVSTRTADTSGFADTIAAEVRRGADTADQFSTRSSKELEEILRGASTLGLETLLNQGGVSIDLEHDRIFRDSFWKGSFAKDSLLGLEERIRNFFTGQPKNTATTFTGGSFWKRFDRIANDTAFGYVVNYELTALPGLPQVRREIHPDDKRRYFAKGDPILLLRYTNDPYKAVYDTIKVIDNDNAIGVMHVGEYPNGTEVAKFVMARHNYPLENMSVEDHEFIFQGAAPVAPSSEALRGKWTGRLIFLETPDTSLANQFNPILLQTEFRREDGETIAHWTAGSASPQRKECLAGELRMPKPGLLLGRWTLPDTDTDIEKLKRSLGSKSERQELRFVLTQASS